MGHKVNINFDVENPDDFFVGVISAFMKCSKVFIDDAPEENAAMEADPSLAVLPAIAFLIGQACDDDKDLMAEFINKLVAGILPDHAKLQGVQLMKNNVNAGYFEATPENRAALREAIDKATADGEEMVAVGESEMPVEVARKVLDLVEQTIAKIEGETPTTTTTKH